MRTASTRITKVCLWVLGIMVMPSAALADLSQPQTYYAQLNGRVIAAIFDATSMLMKAQGYTTFIVIIATVGFLAAVAKAMVKMELPSLAVNIFVIAVLGTVTFNLKTPVYIYDEAAAFSTTKNDVPAVIAVPAVAVSQFGRWLTKSIETIYTMPGEAKISNGAAFGFHNKIIQDLSTLQVQNTDLSRTVSNFIGDCVMPRITSGQLPLSTIAKSGSLLEVIDNNPLYSTLIKSDMIHTVTFGPTGRDVKTCNEAHTQILADLNNEAGEILASKAATLEQGRSAVMTNAYVAALPAVLQDLTGSGTVGSAQEIVTQNAFNKLLSASFRDVATRTGNNELVVALNLEQAKQAQMTNWMVTSELFKDMAAYLHTVLTVFTISLGPLIVVTLFVPGLAGKMIRTYATILFWLVLWEPVLSILNYISYLFSVNTLQASVICTLECQKNPVSLDGLMGMSVGNTKLTLLTNFMAASVPMWIWGLLKGGSIAFTSFIEGSVGGGGFGSSAASNIAGGNISGRKIDYATSNYGKQDFTETFSGGIRPTELNDGAVATTHADYGSGESMTIANQAMRNRGSLTTGGASEVRNSGGAGGAGGSRGGIGSGGNVGVDARDAIDSALEATKLKMQSQGSSKQAGAQSSSATQNANSTSLQDQQAWADTFAVELAGRLGIDLGGKGRGGGKAGGKAGKGGSGGEGGGAGGGSPYGPLSDLAAAIGVGVDSLKSILGIKAGAEVSGKASHSFTSSDSATTANATSELEAYKELLSSVENYMNSQTKSETSRAGSSTTGVDSASSGTSGQVGKYFDDGSSYRNDGTSTFTGSWGQMTEIYTNSNRGRYKQAQANWESVRQEAYKNLGMKGEDFTQMDFYEEVGRISKQRQEDAKTEANNKKQVVEDGVGALQSEAEKRYQDYVDKGIADRTSIEGTDIPQGTQIDAGIDQAKTFTKAQRDTLMAMRDYLSAQGNSVSDMAFLGSLMDQEKRLEDVADQGGMLDALKGINSEIGAFFTPGADVSQGVAQFANDMPVVASYEKVTEGLTDDQVREALAAKDRSFDPKGKTQEYTTSNYVGGEATGETTYAKNDDGSWTATESGYGKWQIDEANKKAKIVPLEASDLSENGDFIRSQMDRLERSNPQK